MRGSLTKYSYPFKGSSSICGGPWIEVAIPLIYWCNANVTNTQPCVFFRHLLKGQGREPRWLVTDKLRSYDAAHRTVMPTVEHINATYANTRAEVSHQPTRQREYHMRGLASSSQAQRFLMLHGLTQNLFRLGRHLMQAENYRLLRTQAFQVWKATVCACEA